ncbi:hypothetical protein [Pseudoalteromonas sp. PS5]|uniref:hypothetical protein n=1 Tax=Pseudoalteromonas sp. PS5 TaxID=1437473 RepID=UPI000FFE7FF6|nr:hypothetical protein [Pseudoalteromonas sp. PS5]RXF01985.1 hypothetical protein D9603_12140 [Pseudoalteromonas sp. PS5]
MINKLTPLAVLVALLSLSDYVSLIIIKANIPDVFVMFVFFGLSLASLIYYNFGKVSASQLWYMFFVLLYFAVTSILNINNLSFEALNVLLSFFTGVFLYLVIKKKKLFRAFRITI